MRIRAEELSAGGRSGDDNRYQALGCGGFGGEKLKTMINRNMAQIRFRFLKDSKRSERDLEDQEGASAQQKKKRVYEIVDNADDGKDACRFV